MKSFLAAIIAILANIITFSLSPFRRLRVKILVRERLQPNAHFQTKYGVLSLYENTWSSAYIAEWFHTYELDTKQWIDEMPENFLLWDIGANIGSISLYAGLRSKAVSAQGRILAFEPAAGTYGMLTRNIEMNSMSDFITGYCIAFTEETRLDMLNMANTVAGGWSHGFGSEIDEFGDIIDTKFRQGSVGLSIDDFVSIFSPPPPTHLKIDVDGIEGEILRGGREMLSLPSVRSVLIELRDFESERNREILALMIELGFTPRPETSSEFRNVVFDK